MDIKAFPRKFPDQKVSFLVGRVLSQFLDLTCIVNLKVCSSKKMLLILQPYFI